MGANLLQEGTWQFLAGPLTLLSLSPPGERPVCTAPWWTLRMRTWPSRWFTGRPAWVRTRWALLLLFWLGWLGMLAGAVVIIVQAPRCRELPEQRWWHKGALYRIGDLRAFLGQEAGNLAGVIKSLTDVDLSADNR